MTYYLLPFFRDKLCLVNPAKILIALKYHVVKGDDQALTKEDYVCPLQVIL